MRLSDVAGAVTKRFDDIILDHRYRMRIQYVAVYVLLAIVAAGMSVVNIVTGETTVLVATAAFTVLCCLNLLLTRLGDVAFALSRNLFQIEMIALFTFFIVSGSPDGFSAIWAALLPAGGMLLFEKRHGTVMSLVVLAILIFFFWCPAGQQFLMYPYSATFMLRFPLLYTAFFLVALLMEIILERTYASYEFLSSHDPLTGALNRRGFLELSKEWTDGKTQKSLFGKDKVDQETKADDSHLYGAIILDLDHFKSVNDTYNHFVGDEVLKYTVNLIKSVTDLPICRWGGEEFALFVPNGEEAKSMADRICTAFSENEYTDGAEITINQRASIGVATKNCTKDTLDVLALISEADGCLDRAKGGGRAQVVYKALD